MNLDTFDDLLGVICEWYECSASDLALPKQSLGPIKNDVLRDYYAKFGRLADRDSPFKHLKSNNGPLSCQDIVLPVNELRDKDGFTVFGAENQDVFVIAASDVPDDNATYAEGDCIEDHYVSMSANGVPLTECLITMTLRETILSVGDRYRYISPARADEAFKVAETGQHIQSRYIWSDVMFDFYLSKPVWFMEFQDNRHYAHRGLWKKGRSTWQDAKFKGGAVCSMGPGKPTIAQKIEKIWTGWKYR